MDFCNKMDFLMKLTQMTNKELAAEISVDRSLISLLRTGRRGIPHNKLHIKNMAESFAKRVTANFQRQALAEISGMANLRAEISPAVLAVQLERWLLGDMDIVEQILDEIEQDTIPNETIGAPSAPFPTGNTLFFYGDEGRRDALRYIMRMGALKDDTIGIFNNTDISWILSDPALTAEIQTAIKHHLEKGSTLTQILPPLSDISSYTDSLRFLLPIYTKGKTKVFYSPRLISPYFSAAMIIAQGRYVMISHGPRSGSSKAITIISTDREFVNAHAEQFREYLSHCKSALEMHKKPREFAPTISEFLSMRGDICQKTSTLSISSMPSELLEMYENQSASSVRKEFFRIISNELPMLEKHLASQTHIDICRLDTVEDIKAGKIPVAFPYIPCKEHPFYTPETYALHLKNILRLMDTYEGYTFIPVTHETHPGCDLLVNDRGMALLIHGDPPVPLMLEFHRPEIVVACKEHLMRIVDKEGGMESSRARSRAQLNSLIHELRKTSRS